MPAPGIFHDGEAYYRWALKAGTTTNRSPEEIHQLGLEQVKAIQARMDSIMRKQGHDRRHGRRANGSAGQGSRASFIPTRPRAASNYSPISMARVADIRTRMPRAFATLVPGKLDHQAGAARDRGRSAGRLCRGGVDRRQGAGPILHQPARHGGSGRGSRLPTLTYHEGIPGHIWQGEYANRMALIRSLLAFNAYTEGWALYAEQLADELGVYDDDPLGAARLSPVESASALAGWWSTPGLHAKHWTRRAGQSIGSSPPMATTADSVASEVDRYCCMAGAGLRLQGRPSRNLAAARQGQGGARLEI